MEPYKVTFIYVIIYLKENERQKKNLVLNESKYDEGDLCEI